MVKKYVLSPAPPFLPKKKSKGGGGLSMKSTVRGGKAESIGFREFNLQLSAGIEISVGIGALIDVAP